MVAFVWVLARAPKRNALVRRCQILPALSSGSGRTQNVLYHMSDGMGSSSPDEACRWSRLTGSVEGDGNDGGGPLGDVER